MKAWIAAMTWLLCSAFAAQAEWEAQAVREAIAPEFLRDGDHLVLKSKGGEGENGYWKKTFPVEGGRWYEFSAERLAEDVEHPRRSILVKLTWLDAAGNLVPRDEDTVMHYFNATGPDKALPEFPRDEGPVGDDGWFRLKDGWMAPPTATHAEVELHFRWAPGGKVTWRNVTLSTAEKPEARIVRLAAAHLRPTAGEPLANMQQYGPLVEEAARQKADLVVLGECINAIRVDTPLEEHAETVPGPSTDYLAELAKAHEIHIVAGLFEKAGDLVYNVAVLIDPNGEVTGKYRKVTLPREEIAKGVAPGSEYPVFETEFGKLGMMVCYDVFFPEVARRLAMNGAEVIAMPIWGGNPLLASARACENHVYLVSSTYTDHEQDWMKSGIWGHEGQLLKQADDWGMVVVQEVDLNARTVWRHLGDFQSRIPREGPIWEAEVERSGVPES